MVFPLLFFIQRSYFIHPFSFLAHIWAIHQFYFPFIPSWVSFLIFSTVFNPSRLIYFQCFILLSEQLASIHQLIQTFQTSKNAHQ